MSRKRLNKGDIIAQGIPQKGELMTYDDFLSVIEQSSFTVSFVRSSAKFSVERRSVTYPGQQFLKAYTFYLRELYKSQRLREVEKSATYDINFSFSDLKSNLSTVIFSDHVF